MQSLFSNLFSYLNSFVTPRKHLHSTHFWQEKCHILQSQVNCLTKQLSDLEETRHEDYAILARRRVDLEEKQRVLEIYQTELDIWRCEIESGGCACHPPCLNSVERVDPPLVDEAIDFEGEISMCLHQLLVSHATAFSITLSVQDLQMKADVDDLECLGHVIRALISYTHKSGEDILSRTKSVMEDLMDPENRIESELRVLGVLPEIEGLDVLKIITSLINLDVIHSPSLCEWKDAASYPGIKDLINQMDRTATQSWELDYTICGDGCDCEQFNFESSASSTSTAVDNEEHHSILKWSSEKMVREFDEERNVDHVETLS